MLVCFYVCSFPIYSSICPCSGRNNSRITLLTMRTVSAIQSEVSEPTAVGCTRSDPSYKFYKLLQSAGTASCFRFYCLCPPSTACSSQAEKHGDSSSSPRHTQPPAKVVYLTNSFEALLSESEIKVLAVMGQEGMCALSSCGALFCHYSSYELLVY